MHASLVEEPERAILGASNRCLQPTTPVAPLYSKGVGETAACWGFSVRERTQQIDEANPK